LQLWLVVQPVGGETSDVAIDVSSDAPAHALVYTLARRVGMDGEGRAAAYCVRSQAWIGGEEPVSSLDLRNGDRLLISPDGPVPTRETTASVDEVPFRVAVVGGPEAGLRVSLAVGEHLLGRGASCTVQLGDPSLSSEHVRLRVSADGVHVSDAGSSNGTFVEGEAVSQERLVEPGQVVAAGRSLLTFERREPRESPPTAQNGSVLFNRPPQVRPRMAPRTIDAPEPPDEGHRMRPPMAAAVVPLFGGIALWLFTQNPVSLVFAGLTPIMALWTFLEDRRRGKKSFGKRTGDFRRKLDGLEAELQAGRAEEVRVRRRRSPDGAELVERARRCLPGLWERRPDDEDFLALRVGSADRPALLQVSVPSRGNEELRAEIEELVEPYRTVSMVPVVAPLPALGTVGISGPPDRVAAHGRWLAMQAAALHSPRDLVLCAAVSRDRLPDWDWLKWLPHTRSAGSPLETHLAADQAGTRALLGELLALLEERRSEEARFAAGPARHLPQILLILDEAVSPERSQIGPILAEGGAYGMCTVWLGSDARALPGECRGVIELDPEIASLRLTDTESGEIVDGVIEDDLSRRLARDTALALAPVVDASATEGRSRLPREVSLLELLELDDVAASAVAERWRSHAGERTAALGAGPEGTFVVDLVRDGPHSLIGGTTGSGKSELLQTLVTSLAMTAPPDRLNFLLVDYKGGAAFKECVGLPHTVGFVTDLDAHLTQRARISLDAELKRREAVLREAGAKDLQELERLNPAGAPPSLVIVVDEFATLANEIPDFVEGVVDVAQRGRTLGLHLVLATQRPRGAVTDNIRANTNLRIAMRMADAAESQDVIGAPDAARIPRSLPGRAFALTGHGELNEVQAAYVGGSSSGTPAGPTVRVGDLRFGGIPDDSDGGLRSEEQTDLQRIVEAAAQAAAELGIPRQPSPWLPPLPDVVALSSLEAQPGVAALGLVDEPALQRQRGLTFDPERDGSILVYGTSGSGKTTLLRTLAVSLARGLTPDELHVYGLDFATRGLDPLHALPHCGSVIAGEDEERVTRLFSFVQKTIAQRKDLLARSGASTISQLEERDPSARLPRLLVLLDGYAAFVAAHDRVNAGELVEALPRLVSDGRPLGVHFAIAAERRGAVRPALTSVIQTRIVLRMADDDEYAALGIEPRTFRGVTLPPGRGFAGGSEVQLALVGDDPASEVSSTVATGEDLTARHDSRAPAIQLLPDDVPRSTMPVPAHPLEAFLGISDETLEPTSIQLDDGHFLVAGPRRSGRSTTLETIARSLRSGGSSLELHLMAPRRTGLTGLDLWTSAVSGLEECEGFLASFADRVAARPPGRNDEPVVLVVDDGDELTEGRAAGALEKIGRRGRDVGVWIVAAAEAHAAHRTFGGWLRELRNEEHGLLLVPQVDVDGDLLGVRLPRRSSAIFPPGRGYLVRRGRVELVQVAAG
jgi:S-DNA-T family DNA segregation ATPase FtsK/SpoIIIE